MTRKSLIECDFDSELGKYVLKRESLRTGDKLQGKIIEVKRSGRVLIDFGEFRAVADVDFPIRVGEKLLVSVMAKGTKLTLKLENPQRDISPEARNMIGKIDVASTQPPGTNIRFLIDKVMELESTMGSGQFPQNISDAMTRVGEFFEPIDTAKGLLKLFTQLKTALNRSGIFFEKDLETVIDGLSRGAGKIPGAKELVDHPKILEIIREDLKPNLLVLKEYFGRPGVLRQAGGGVRRMESLRRMVEELLQNIRTKQHGSVDRHSAGQALREPTRVFKFLLPLAENETHAKLKVYYNKKDTLEGKKGFRLSLLLSMDRLGDVRTDFHLVRKSLNITFFVKNHDAVEEMESGINDVKNALAGMFEYLVLKVIVSERKISEFDTEDLNINITPSSVLDVKV